MRLVTDLQERLVLGSSWDGDRCEVESDRQRMSVTSVDKSVYSTLRLSGNHGVDTRRVLALDHVFLAGQVELHGLHINL